MSRDAALIETVRVIGGLAPLWPLHVERLEEGARALRITLATLDRPSGGADRVVRFEVSSHGVRVPYLRRDRAEAVRDELVARAARARFRW